MLTRREMLIGLGALYSLPLLGSELKKSSDLSFSGSSHAADEWMLQWITESRKPTSGEEAPVGALYVGRFADPVYFLRESIGWKPNPPQQTAYEPVQVPVGFVTDFASIPRLFWSLLRPDGLYAYAAIIHDYLYWEQFLPRSKSDEVLKLCMQDFGVGAFRKWVIYFAVRLGGAGAWSDNAALKAAGEKRILKRFPDDPTTRWAEWKIKADVY